MEAISNRKDELVAAYSTVRTFSTNFDVRKMAAVTKHDRHNFYILCGWMTQKDAAAFQKEIERDEDTFCIIEDDHNNIMSNPPTKMKNPGLFRPFEMYVEMYGLPSYNELDPTIPIGITYSILFGFMFRTRDRACACLSVDTCCTVSRRCGWQASYPAAVCFPLYSVSCLAVSSGLRI